MILIVDDDRSYVEALSTLLLNVGGYEEVRIAYTGKDALDIVRAVTPDAIVLDMMIPYDQDDINGASVPAPTQEPRGLLVAREMKGLGFDLSRAVAITALPDESVRGVLEDVGIRHVLTKPVLASEILQNIGQVLNIGGG